MIFEEQKNMKRTRLLLLYTFAVVLIGFAFASCVTARKYDALKAKYDKLAVDSAEYQRQLVEFTKNKAELDADIKELTEENRKLKADSAQAGVMYRRNKSLLDDLFDKYDRLDKSYNQLLSNSATESGTLSKNLSQKEKELLSMEQNLMASKAQIDKLSIELQGREARVKELEKVLADKDKAVNDLKNRVNSALLGFKEGDLTVDIRNGKVYVSLSEKLLFKSGSYAVDTKGVEALKKLASVLKTQTDVNVLVEGHTDDVPVAKGTVGVDDNWDLSALRATSIVNILVKEGVTPTRLTAAGRGEYLPIATGKTPEARQKNRRTEIILTPKLDELFKILESN
jgi:chemotaxis protein MotB